MLLDDCRQETYLAILEILHGVRFKLLHEYADRVVARFGGVVGACGGVSEERSALEGLRVALALPAQGADCGKTKH